MIDEGYIKYQCKWIESSEIPREKLQKINHWRDKLYKLNMIGEYSNGIGFGNLSVRDNNLEEFIISGTQTGSLSSLNEKHYTKVIEFDWDKNFVCCCGPIQASSESLTHGAVYVANPKVNGVIHIHHLELWQKLMNKVPTTSKDCAYGTPEMAREIVRLCQEDCLPREQIIVMSGHQEGIITFGSDLEEAGNILMKYYNNYLD